MTYVCVCVSALGQGGRAPNAHLPVDRLCPSCPSATNVPGAQVQLEGLVCEPIGHIKIKFHSVQTIGGHCTQPTRGWTHTSP